MRSQDIAAYYTIYHEISRHCCILYNTPLDLKTLLHIINIPRELKTGLHIIQYTTRSQDIAAYYTIHHEISGHCCILYNTPRDLKTRLHIIHYTTRSEDIAAYYKYTPRDLKKLLHIIQYTTRSQDIAAYYTIHHEISIHCCILYDTPRDLKTLLHIIQYTTSSQDTVTHSDSQCLSKLRCNVHLKRELRGALHKCRN